MIMPRHKKRKLNSNNSQANDISQEEIWDDSALIRSWEDAYAEYQFYHSIHARGEDVDEVLARAEAEEAGNADTKLEGSEAKIEEIIAVNDESTNGVVQNVQRDDESETEEGELEDEQAEATAPDLTNGEVNGGEVAASERIGPPLPADLNAEVNELAGVASKQQQAETSAMQQTLENIKMAYYWAGYYSGLYDGHQQVASQSTTQKNGEG